MKRRLSLFCKDPLQEFARATENPRKKESLCTILSLKFQEILIVIIDRPVERVVKGGGGGSRSRFTENKTVLSQFMKNKIGVSRFMEKKENVLL